MAAPRTFLISALFLSVVLLLPEAQDRAHAGSPGCTITVNTATDSIVPDGLISIREATRFATDAAQPAAVETPQITGCPGSDPGAALADRIVFDPSVFPGSPPVTIGLGGPLSLNTGGDTIDGGPRAVILDGASLNDCVWIYDSSGNEIEGLSLQNCNYGVYIYSTSATTADNAVRDSHFGGNVFGIAIAGGPERTIVEGNLIGPALITPTGTQPNGAGIGIENATDTTIGGVTPGARNVVSGNTGDGITIAGTGATGNKVIGNYIGTTQNGQSAMGNGNDGVRIVSAPANEVRGNVISASTYAGVSLHGSSAEGNLIRENLIGTNAAGSAALANGGEGLVIVASPDNTVEDNIISGNSGPGISVLGPDAAGNVLRRNLIGVAVNGSSPLGNGLVGIGFYATGPNIIGGDTAESGNLIAYNAGAGIEIVPNAPISTRKLITQNSIHSNGGLGIDLAAGVISADGVTPNDDGDGDFGGNELQNYPEFTVATLAGSQLHAGGQLNSAPNTQFRIELFANETCDPSGYGEGERFLAFTIVTTDGAGSTPVDVVLSATASVGEFLSATATDPNNNTSEFSQCVQIALGATPTPTPTHTSAPTPTATATPTPTPGPAGFLGDTDCDEEVDSVDALWVLREIAQIGTPPACIDQGDVQCDGDRDSVDSLGILRYVAQLPPISQQPGCPPIGPVQGVNMGDNYFDPDEILLEAGKQVTLLLLNVGDAVHNVRAVGPDGHWNTVDDVLSDPELVLPAGTARLAFAYATPGDYEFRCDFHPADHVGVVHVA